MKKNIAIVILLVILVVLGSIVGTNLFRSTKRAAVISSFESKINSDMTDKQIIALGKDLFSELKKYQPIRVGFNRSSAFIISTGGNSGGAKATYNDGAWEATDYCSDLSDGVARNSYAGNKQGAMGYAYLYWLSGCGISQ